MSRLVINVITGMILLLGGYFHGVKSDRWGVHPDTSAAAKKLSKIPKEIGSWHSEDIPIEEEILEAAGAKGYLSRRYFNQEIGKTVLVTIVCGRHGPIATHDPTICFVGSGWDLKPSPVKHTFQTDKSQKVKEFWMANFERNSATGTDKIRTFWAWSVSGDWQAADSPRIEYANSPFLFKIYLSHGLTDVSDPTDDDTKEFLELLLSEIDHTLFESDVDLKRNSSPDGSVQNKH